MNSDEDNSSQRGKFTTSQKNKDKERITIEGELYPAKVFSKFNTILKNLNKELFLMIITKIKCQEETELTNDIKSTGNFLSASSSH